MPQLSPADILANSARLKASPSSVNMDSYADIFAGPAEGTSPSMFESQSRGHLADGVETMLGAGPAVSGLRRSADERRRQERTDIQTDNANYGEFALDQGMAEAGVESQVGDVLSESKARRGFLPFGQKANDRAFGQAAEQNDIRYGQPARLDAQSRVNAAGITAQGRANVESSRQSQLPIKALFDALGALIESKGGAMPSPEEIDRLKEIYGGIQ